MVNNNGTFEEYLELEANKFLKTSSKAMTTGTTSVTVREQGGKIYVNNQELAGMTKSTTTTLQQLQASFCCASLLPGP